MIKVLLLSFLLAVNVSAKTKPKAKKVKKMSNPIIEIKTSMGDMTLELDAEKAPETVKNFLAYVDNKFYNKTIFHRVITVWIF